MTLYSNFFIHKHSSVPSSHVRVHLETITLDLCRLGMTFSTLWCVACWGSLAPALEGLTIYLRICLWAWSWQSMGTLMQIRELQDKMILCRSYENTNVTCVQRVTTISTNLSIFVCRLWSSKNESSISLGILDKPITKLSSNHAVYTIVRDRMRRTNLVDRDKEQSCQPLHSCLPVWTWLTSRPMSLSRQWKEI